MTDETTDRIARIRRFNRFYTTRIGVLEEKLLRSPFSLTEARVIYELARLGTATATQLGGELRLDAGYLSRILRTFRPGYARMSADDWAFLVELMRAHDAVRRASRYVALVFEKPLAL